MIEAKSIMDLKNLELSNWSQIISLLWLRQNELSNVP